MLIWGTGRATAEVIGRYIMIDDVEAFIETTPSRKEFFGKKVYSASDIAKMDYDAIIVITSHAREIYEECLTFGIDMKKLIYVYGNCEVKDLNEDYAFVKDVLGNKFAKIIEDRYHLVRYPDAAGDLFLKDHIDLLSDYTYAEDGIRIQSFNLAVKEIRKRKISGNVAEVGVFRGEFAQYINRAFPDRTLYLFDTFEGFNDEEALHELEQGHCTEGFIQAFKDTSLEAVFSKMKYLDKIVIKKGLFPESLDGLNDTFAFVSIDVDFEQSIYDCLDYFYPRLTQGGYIFIHDYNSPLLGVERAIDSYEKNNNIQLCKMPISDACGTLVITK